MIGSSPLARAIVTGLAAWLLLEISGVPIVFTMFPDLGDWSAVGVFLLPVLLAVAAGVWAYRHAPPATAEEPDEE